MFLKTKARRVLDQEDSGTVMQDARLRAAIPFSGVRGRRLYYRGGPPLGRGYLA
jgi:hypothetical protein